MLCSDSTRDDLPAADGPVRPMTTISSDGFRVYLVILAVSPLTGLLTSRSNGDVACVSTVEGWCGGWLVGLHRWNVKVTERKSVKVLDLIPLPAKE